MAVKKYVATKDNTITNAFGEVFDNRLTGTNAGLADSVEVFSIYGQNSPSASLNENSRILIEFPISTISGNIDDGTIESGSNFVLRLFSAEQPETPPKDFTLVIAAVSRSWTEGTGPDLANKDYTGVSNWESASSGVAWTTAGGDYHATPRFTASFTTGEEDMEVDVTSLVNEWLEGTKTNYGFGIFLTSSQEDVSASYYTKRFYSRTSEYVIKRPVLESRYDDAKKDNASTFYLSSALAPAADNLNNLYLYNYINGQLQNLPDVGTGEILLSIYSGTTAPAGSKLKLPTGGGVVTDGDTNVTGSHVSTGIYSASFAYASSSITTVFPVWHSGSVEYATGSAVSVLTFDSLDNRDFDDFVILPVSVKQSYSTAEKARIKLYVRPKDWSPTIYPDGTETASSTIIEDLYYKITRVSDDLEFIPYGTGSGNDAFTKTSYDGEGNYFELDFSQFEAGYKYRASFVVKKDLSFIEQEDNIVFRVD
jgi:hypothetical protein